MQVMHPNTHAHQLKNAHSQMPAELKYISHDNACVKRLAVLDVYSYRMRYECKDYKMYSFLAAYPSPIVLRCR